MLSPFQEPGSIQLKPLKESTQAWLAEKKIKVSLRSGYKLVIIALRLAGFLHGY